MECQCGDSEALGTHWKSKDSNCCPDGCDCQDCKSWQVLPRIEVGERMTDLELLQLKCEEAELALSHCSAVFELIPISELEKGHQWIPSDICLLLLEKAKNSVNDYVTTHQDLIRNE